MDTIGAIRIRNNKLALPCRNNASSYLNKMTVFQNHIYDRSTIDKHTRPFVSRGERCGQVSFWLGWGNKTTWLGLNKRPGLGYNKYISYVRVHDRSALGKLYTNHRLSVWSHTGHKQRSDGKGSCISLFHYYITWLPPLPLSYVVIKTAIWSCCLKKNINLWVLLSCLHRRLIRLFFCSWQEKVTKVAQHIFYQLFWASVPSFPSSMCQRGVDLPP